MSRSLLRRYVNSAQMTSDACYWVAAPDSGSPPTREPSCGVHIHDTSTDLLIWAGEIVLPTSWLRGGDAQTFEAKARAIVDRLRRDGLESLAQMDGGFCGAWHDRTRERWQIFN